MFAERCTRPWSLISFKVAVCDNLKCENVWLRHNGVSVMRGVSSGTAALQLLV
jgi:hypothetical protein